MKRKKITLKNYRRFSVDSLAEELERKLDTYYYSGYISNRAYSNIREHIKDMSEKDEYPYIYRMIRNHRYRGRSRLR